MCARPEDRLNNERTNMAKRPSRLIKLCPKICSGGYAERQRSLYEGQMDSIPADILAASKGNLQYCTYCHAVWEDRVDYKKIYGHLIGRKFSRYKGY
jgi:hypothetical protein